MPRPRSSPRCRAFRLTARPRTWPQTSDGRRPAHRGRPGRRPRARSGAASAAGPAEEGDLRGDRREPRGAGAAGHRQVRQVSVDAAALFDEANRLWFGEGATARALARYDAAARAAPDDPVIAFQLARALWALGRTDEAASALAVAETNADRLTSLGRTLLGRARAQLAAPPRDTLPVDAASLDVDVLERLDLPAERWLDVAFAARQREMYGLAAHAFARGSSFHVTELDEEEHAMRKEASSALNMLEVMRAEPRPTRPRL